MYLIPKDNVTLEICYKPRAIFKKWDWWFSKVSQENDKSRLFYFTICGCHFYYFRSKSLYKKMIEEAESTIFKFDGRLK